MNEDHNEGMSHRKNCKWMEEDRKVGEKIEDVVKTYKAAAPEMISMSSLVMTACLVRLKVRVSLSIISAEAKGEKNQSRSNLNLYGGRIKSMTQHKLNHNTLQL